MAIAQSDSVTLNSDGTISVVIGGKKATLRRPTFGEFREIREELHKINDHMLSTTRSLADDPERADGVSDIEWARQRGDVMLDRQRLLRETTREFEDQTIALMRQCVEKLGNLTLPPDDELPVWLADAGLLPKFIEQWRTVPLSPGDR